VVRVASAGGPFDEGDLLSMAFSTPPACRLLRHGTPVSTVSLSRTDATIVPEAISVTVVVPAGTYGVGEVLVLSFVDPSVAHIHAAQTRLPAAAPAVPAATRTAVEVPVGSPRAMAARDGDVPQAVVAVHGPSEPTASSIVERESTDGRATSGLRTRLLWSSDRARRFVQVCDKLFTVDRLGWHRHALTMRLLIPDEVACGNATANREIAEHLRVLRASALESLGRPLLAAFMPNFAVTPEWLDALDDPAAARALAALREIFAAHATDNVASIVASDPAWTEGEVSRVELDGTPPTSCEALLPLLIANLSPLAAVTEKLTAYRRALIELFGQTAGSAETVRLSHMAQPNHILDDRLWQLVGAVGEGFGGLSVAS
jgi:hypothetical protein